MNFKDHQKFDAAQKSTVPAKLATMRGGGPWNILRSLSARLLVLTVIFVMIAEILIFVPSVANFRNVWLQGHLQTAEAASIVYLDATDAMLSPAAQQQLLKSTDSIAVVLRGAGTSRLMAASDTMTQSPITEIDLTHPNALDAIAGALATMFTSSQSYYRVFGPMRDMEGVIELVQNNQHLRSALWRYARNVMLLSLAISLITAALVYLALYYMIVRPIRHISNNMTAFSHQPENASLIFKPSGRSDEIGTAETRLAAFQSDLQDTLRQKQHLADLGLAVSKINHDLRNILASAQLFSDRLLTLKDPDVQRFAPRLIRTIDRAVGYTSSVIAYGRAVENKPVPRLHHLQKIVEDVYLSLGMDRGDTERQTIEWRNEVDQKLEVFADSEQLFRILMNLCRNAVQAMTAESEHSNVSRLHINAAAQDHCVQIDIKDTGPGIPEKLQEKLFTPFGGSAKANGSGLGLSIAAELVKAHGGTINLVHTSSAGTHFQIKLPNQEIGKGGTTQSLDRDNSENGVKP